MTLPSTGAITMQMVKNEIGIGAGVLTLGDSRVRTLAGRPTGSISMSHLRGKAWKRLQNVTKSMSVAQMRALVSQESNSTNSELSTGSYYIIKPNEFIAQGTFYTPQIFYSARSFNSGNQNVQPIENATGMGFSVNDNKNASLSQSSFVHAATVSIPVRKDEDDDPERKTARGQYTAASFGIYTSIEESSS